MVRAQIFGHLAAPLFPPRTPPTLAASPSAALRWHALTSLVALLSSWRQTLP